jgi:hypothetical protein
MCPAKGLMRAIGYDRTNALLPEAVTRSCEIAPAPAPQPA